jgi:hypothetical protein
MEFAASTFQKICNLLKFHSSKHLASIHQNVGPDENYIIPKGSPLQPQPIGITNHN